ncbi:MAG: histidine triad nucleotide-binding protein [Firmicutes bacterium RBG_13_65_8]|nr:MAG: histidine triad nucleotide-binding protein [Firmicutes bacterium RBG_13_65_8]
MSECIFCAIASGRIPSQTLYSDDRVVAFRDVNPAAPVHFLVIPRAHIPTVSNLDSDSGGLLLTIHQVIGMLAKKEGIDRTGFRVVVNNGEGAGQSVGHLHYHVLGGREMGWPPG